MKHDKLYFEYFASICIKDTINKKFKKIAHSDAPDLKIGKECGIEVTQLGDQEEFLMLSIVDKKKSGEYIAHKDYVKTENYMLTEDNMIIRKNGFCDENIWNTIQGKINKLQNGNYNGFDEYGLFMFLTETTDTVSPQNIIDIFKKQDKNKKYYRYIFICCGTDFYFYDVNTKKIEYYNIALKIKKYRNYAFNKQREEKKKNIIRKQKEPK